MTIETELLSFLDIHISDLSNKERDTEIIAYFYGLRGTEWPPTLQETAIRNGLSHRQRAEQILNGKFRSIAKVSDLPSLLRILEVVQERRFWSVTELTHVLVKSDLVKDGCSLKGLLNLINDLGIDHGVDIFTPELKKASRSSVEIYEQHFVIDLANIKKIKSFYNKARKLPGRCGIANLRYLEEENEEFNTFGNLIAGLIKSSKNVWTKPTEEGLWYIYENRENTLFHYSEKVFSAIDHCDAGRLATVYRNALNSRKYKYPYPPERLIEEYLRSSVFFENNDGVLSYLGEPNELNDIEKDVVSYLKSNGSVQYPEMSSFLDSKGYGRPYIVKSTTSSPLVYVDKSKGRSHYQYSLVGDIANVQQVPESSENRYRKFLLKLRKLVELGTDETVEQIRRREQSILREWLFKDKKQENCSVCGNKFGVYALVTAHKKKRATCHDGERTDPNIVMPVCMMGCDYLYENQHIYIENGVVKKGLPVENVAHEAVIIDKLIGRIIDARWLKGSDSYFLSPDI